MDQNFVPYRESIELKNLGFSEDCMSIHVLDLEEEVEDGVVVEEEHTVMIFHESLNDGEHANNACLPENYEDCIAAPTWNDAFDWLRTNYNLDCYQTQTRKDGMSYWKVSKIQDEDKVGTWSDSIGQARLDSIREAIKIAKESQS